MTKHRKNKADKCTLSQQDSANPRIKKIWKVYLGGIPQSTTEEELSSAILAKVENFNSRIFTNKSNNSAGCGAIDVYNQTDYETLLNEKIIVKGKKIEVNKFIDNQSELDHYIKLRDKKSLFVGNLGCAITEPSFRRYFSKFGPMEDAYIIFYDDKKTNSRGFGFVQYRDEKSAVRAVNTPVHLLQGRELTVGFRSSKKEHTDSTCHSSSHSSAHDSGSGPNSMIIPGEPNHGKYVHSKGPKNQSVKDLDKPTNCGYYYYDGQNWNPLSHTQQVPIPQMQQYPQPHAYPLVPMNYRQPPQNQYVDPPFYYYEQHIDTPNEQNPGYYPHQFSKPIISQQSDYFDGQNYDFYMQSSPDLHSYHNLFSHNYHIINPARSQGQGPTSQLTRGQPDMKAFVSPHFTKSQIMNDPKWNELYEKTYPFNEGDSDED